MNLLIINKINTIILRIKIFSQSNQTQNYVINLLVNKKITERFF